MLNRIVIFVVITAAGHGEIQLAPLFCNGAVLQRGKPVPVWGRCGPLESIEVEFAHHLARTMADDAGNWQVTLPPLPASSESRDLVITSITSRRVVRDVLVGEVWLCAGQSNMEFPVEQSLDAQQVIAKADYPTIRLITIAQKVEEAPVEMAAGEWQSANSTTVGAFSAVGYFFARDLHDALSVPIGIIVSAWGGTPIESWMSARALASDPAFAVVNQRWQDALRSYAERKLQYDLKLAVWEEDYMAARNAGSDSEAAFLRTRPRTSPPPGKGSPKTPTVLYNGMIHPLKPFSLRGVIWYQGESNASRANEYGALFIAMIRQWREDFAQGDLPFFFTQIANFYAWNASNPSWAQLREAQAQALALPNTGMAVTIDVGSEFEVHPPNKQPVGQRLAQIAKTRLYGIPGEYSGPVFTGAEREGSVLRTRFTHTTDGLVLMGSGEQAFEIAGIDQIFHLAHVAIDGDTLVLKSDFVSTPVVVRYAWQNAPKAVLFNGAGFPASPFRSALPAQ